MPKTFGLAIFPIPGMVCFPGQVITLHVFEPRYRQMVRDCLKDKRELGVSLPKKMIAENKKKASTVREVLNSNQSVFEPEDVMGAGQVQLLQELPDGRFLIEVEITHRLQLKEVTQEVPYVIASATEIADDTSGAGSDEHTQRFDRLIQLAKLCLEDQFSAFEEHVRPDVFAERDLTELTFRIFDWCHLLPEQMQEALETTDPKLRADHLIEALEVYLQAIGQDPFKSQKKPTDSDSEKESGGTLVQVDFQKKRKFTDSESDDNDTKS